MRDKNHAGCISVTQSAKSGAKWHAVGFLARPRRWETTRLLSSLVLTVPLYLRSWFSLTVKFLLTSKTAFGRGLFVYVLQHA